MADRDSRLALAKRKVEEFRVQRGLGPMEVTEPKALPNHDNSRKMNLYEHQGNDTASKMYVQKENNDYELEFDLQEIPLAIANRTEENLPLVEGKHDAIVLQIADKSTDGVEVKLVKVEQLEDECESVLSFGNGASNAKVEITSQPLTSPAKREKETNIDQSSGQEQIGNVREWVETDGNIKEPAGKPKVPKNYTPTVPPTDFYKSTGIDVRELEQELVRHRHENSLFKRQQGELMKQLEGVEIIIQRLSKERDDLHVAIETKFIPLENAYKKLEIENDECKIVISNLKEQLNATLIEVDRRKKAFEEMESAFIKISNVKRDLESNFDIETERVRIMEADVRRYTNELEKLSVERSLMTSQRDKFWEGILLERENEIKMLQDRNTELQKEIQDVSIVAEGNCARKFENSEVSEIRGSSICLDHSCGGSHVHEDEPDSAQDPKHNQDLQHYDNYEKETETDEIGIALLSGYERNDVAHGPAHDDSKDTGHSCGHHDHYHLRHDSHPVECEHSEHPELHSKHSEHRNHDHLERIVIAQSPNGPTPIQKKLARLEWENVTYRDELYKVAEALKGKTQDAEDVLRLRIQNEKLRIELAQQEHLVIQLQGENETIGDYILLYQSQKEALREKVRAKDRETEHLGRERMELHHKMEELNSLLQNMNSSTEGKPIKQINELVMSINNTSSHPYSCSVCSGNLLNV